MPSTARRTDTWLVALASVAGWLGLGILDDGAKAGAFCVSTPQWPLGWASFSSLAGGLIGVDGAGRLAGEWGLMIVGMMSPLVLEPLRHVRDRSFASRRGTNMLMFLAGYGAAWLAAGPAIVGLSLVARFAAPSAWAGWAGALLLAAAWQASPAKQWALNRCHRRSPMAAFGRAAAWDALRYGTAQGVSCVGSCWALMLLTLLAAQAHLLLMAAVTLFAVAERLERPAPVAWKWRAPARALRIAKARIG